jgi:nitrogen regulatory protein PII 1
MKMVHAIVRPEKTADVLSALKGAGFAPVSKMSVVGRGRQRGLRSGNVVYDTIPKDNLYIASNDDDVPAITKVIIDSARTNGGTPGDGKIFLYQIEREITLSTGTESE